jgi:hypothetical protein
LIVKRIVLKKAIRAWISLGFLQESLVKVSDHPKRAVPPPRLMLMVGPAFRRDALQAFVESWAGRLHGALRVVPLLAVGAVHFGGMALVARPVSTVQLTRYPHAVGGLVKMVW